MTVIPKYDATIMATSTPTTSETSEAPPHSSQKYIYKIAPASPEPQLDVDGLESVLPPSELDVSSKFIHMSTASQIPGTLKHFFSTSSSTTDTIYLIKVPIVSVWEDIGALRWESPDASVCGTRDGEGMFPHLYFYDHDVEGGRERLWLRRNEVVEVKEIVSREGEEGWEKALGESGEWLM